MMNFGMGNPQYFQPQMYQQQPPGQPRMPSFGPAAINAAPPVHPMPASATPAQPPPPPGPPPPDDAEQQKITMLQNQAKMWQEQRQMVEQQQRQKRQQEEQILQQLAQSNPDVRQCLAEEKQFEEQYTTWKKQFHDWKDQNKDHPDKEQYQQYEHQWKQYEIQMDNQKNELAKRRQSLIEQYKAVSAAPHPPQSDGSWGGGPDNQRQQFQNHGQQPQQQYGQQQGSYNNQQGPPRHPMPGQLNHPQPQFKGPNQPPHQRPHGMQGQRVPNPMLQESLGSGGMHGNNPQQMRPIGPGGPRQPRPSQPEYSPRLDAPAMNSARPQRPQYRGPAPNQRDMVLHQQEPASHIRGVTPHPRGPGPRGSHPPSVTPLMSLETHQLGPGQHRSQWNQTSQPRAGNPRAPAPNMQTQPQIRGQASQARGQAPHARGQAPQARGQTPQVRGQTPHARGQAPQIRGQAPQVRGQAPQIRGQAPQVRGQAPQIRGQAPRGRGQSKGKGNPNYQCEDIGNTVWPRFPRANQGAEQNTNTYTETDDFANDNFDEEDMYDHQKKMIAQLMGSELDAAAVVKADPSVIPEHKPKKPVIDTMSHDTIRKGTLSMMFTSQLENNDEKSAKQNTSEDASQLEDKGAAKSLNAGESQNFTTNQPQQMNTPSHSFSPRGPHPHAPNQRGPASIQRGPTPRQRGPAPGQRGPAPGPAPGQRGPAPRLRGPAPGQRGPAPGQRGPAPGQRGPAPGHRGPAPRPAYAGPSHRQPRPLIDQRSQQPMAWQDSAQQPPNFMQNPKALSKQEHDIIRKAAQDLRAVRSAQEMLTEDSESLVPYNEHGEDDGYGDGYDDGYDEQTEGYYNEEEQNYGGYNEEEEPYYEDDYGPDPQRRPPFGKHPRGPPQHGRYQHQPDYEDWDYERRPPPRHHPSYWNEDAYERPPFPSRRRPPHFDDHYESRYPPDPPSRRDRFYDDPFYNDPFLRPSRGRRPDVDVYPPPPSRRFDEYTDFDNDPYRRRRPPLLPQPAEPPFPREAAYKVSVEPVEVIDYSHRQSHPRSDKLPASYRNFSNDDQDLPANYRRDAGGYRDRSPLRRGYSPPSTARPPVADLFDAYSAITVPQTTDIRDLLCKPNRDKRPAHICLIVRGPPGSGKTYASKLIRDKESANGGSAPRILNLDDYFMVEVERLVTDDDTGKKIKRKMLEYEYEPEMEESYRLDFLKSFKKTVEKGYFSFIIIDAVNDKIAHFEEFAKFARSKGFQVYIVDVMADAQTCFSRNIHSRTLKDIENIIEGWESTPSYFNKVDLRGLLQDDAISDVEMEDKKESESSSDSENDDDDLIQVAQKSKWEMDSDDQKLNKLDGLLHKKVDTLKNMEDFLSLTDDYEARFEDGKKHVRWADIEEKRLQQRDREMGFVVGHTNWNRMLDDDYADKQLNKTKYI